MPDMKIATQQLEIGSWHLRTDFLDGFDADRIARGLLPSYDEIYVGLNSTWLELLGIPDNNDRYLDV